jgi:zinc protease
VQKLATPGGINAWLVEDHGIPIVALAFAIRGGSVEDPAGKEGAGHLLANMLDEGAGSLDADDFKQQLEAVGSELSFSVSQLVFSGSLLSLTKHLDASTELMRIALGEPHLRAEYFKRTRQQETASLAFENRSPQLTAIRQFYARAFAGHPYARPVKGTKETLSALTIEDIRAQHERLITRTGLHVVVVGAIDAQKTLALVDKIFADLPERAEKAAPPSATIKPFQETVPSLPGQSIATTVVALPMPELDDPDFYTAIALNHIVGSGNLDARLTRELRVERGLTYSASSQIIADRVTSMALGVISTEPGKIDEALRAMKEVLARLHENGPEAQELEYAKSGLNGAYLLDLDTSTKLANNLIGLWLDGFDADYGEIRKTKLEAIQMDAAKRAARMLYDVKSLSIITMRPRQISR